MFWPIMLFAAVESVPAVLEIPGEPS